MKTLAVAGALLLVTASPSLAGGNAAEGTGDSRRTYAQSTSYEKYDVAALEARFLVCLNHEVEGIVLGGLREAACMKIAQPEAEMEVIADRISDLVIDGATPTIRYRAFITGMVMVNPWMFREQAGGEYESDDAFFAALAKRLEESVLAEER